MIPLLQSKSHNPPVQNGNCFRTAIACILELDPESIPHFEDMQDEWWQSIQDWAKSQGLEVVPTVFFDQEGGERIRISLDQLQEAKDRIPKGWAVLSGKSPRYKSDHCVVAFDGEIVHDPFPGAKPPYVEDVVDLISFVPLEVN